MKKYISILILTVSTLFAQNEVSSEITSATVYRQNAQLVSEAEGKLPAGTSEIVIRDISTYINPSSLQVAIKSSGKVSLLSATYEVDYLKSKELSAQQQEWKDKLEELNEDLRWIREQKQIYIDLESVLNVNKKLGGADNGLDPLDLSKLLELYKTKQYEYNREFLSFQKQEKDLVVEVAKVQNQLNQVNAKSNKPTGTIRLQVSAVAPSNADFKCTYIISNAGWEPIYDLRSEGTTKPVELAYKANIYQNSGYDWKRVDLVVSTGNPNQNNNRPILYPLYVNYYQAYAYEQSNNRAYKTANTETLNMAYADAPSMDEEVIEGYQNAYAYDAKESSSQFSTQYEVALPQNIPSDGKNHLIGIDSYELESEYAYHTVPKLDCGAFLLAKVSDWGQYNLLPGSANLFFEGAYVGQSSINPDVSSDTLLLSMGRDEGIKITRNELKDFTSKKMMGSNKKETYAYEIEIRNNKSTAVEIEILDQVPVSQQKEIEVELEDGGGAQYNEELGKLEWNISLAPNQSKKLKFVYSVKYPKDKQVNGQK
ncbi:MAG: hypothetical protein ACI9O4_000254 [Chitinophagales bacterium]|jgi:uncharacterized protein (TIGR02231 family)